MQEIIEELTKELEDMIENKEDYDKIVKKSQEIDKLIVLKMKEINKNIIIEQLQKKSCNK